MNSQPLDGTVALVTGGGRGIGAAISTTLATFGASVILAARSRPEIRHIARDIDRSGGRALPVSTDVTDTDQVDELVLAALNEFGRIDFLINAAGRLGPMDRSVWDSDPDDWEDTIRCDVLGVYNTCRAIAPVMLSCGHGKILNLSSPAATSIIPGISAYSVSKAAVDHFTKLLAAELQGTGVTANTFRIGATNTPVFREICKVMYPDIPPRWLEMTARDPCAAAEMLVVVCADQTDGLNGDTIHWDDEWIRSGMADLHERTNRMRGLI